MCVSSYSYQSVYLFIASCLSIAVCLSGYRYSAVCLYLYVSRHIVHRLLPGCQPARIYLSDSLSVCQSVYPAVCLTVCVSVYLSQSPERERGEESSMLMLSAAEWAVV